MSSCLHLCDWEVYGALTHFHHLLVSDEFRPICIFPWKWDRVGPSSTNITKQITKCYIVDCVTINNVISMRIYDHLFNGPKFNDNELIVSGEVELACDHESS